MNIHKYQELHYFLNQDQSTKEQRRTFALKNNVEKAPKHQQLLFWLQNFDHQFSLPIAHHKAVKNLLLFITFLFGLFAAFALLSYSGDKPVNVIYFFTLAVIFPLLSMTLSLFALFFPKFFTPLFLTAWIEKLLYKLFAKESKKSYGSVEASYLLFLVQLGSLFFSIGVLIGFLLTILTHDIAFGWSTTLKISTVAFYDFIQALSWIFHPFCPQSSISLELIEKSHYFRLGQEITASMQNNAALFGEWWRFLACSTLFYAIFLRLIFLFLSYLKLQKSIKETLFGDPSVERLLKDMNEAFISTNSPTKEHFNTQETEPLTQIKEPSAHCTNLLGWSFTEDEILLLKDTINLHAKHTYTLGGNKSLKEENAIIQNLQGDALLLIKAWEIPTMEFIDMLEEMTTKVDHVTIYPLGYPKNNYRANEKDIAIWEKKIASQNFTNVSIKI